MRSVVKIFTLSFCFLAIINILYAQEELQKISNQNFMNGYAKKISGEDISYHSFHPYATDALLTRCTSGNMDIAWETDSVPENYRGSEVYFGWIAGYSCGTSSGDRHFDLYIDDEKILTFTTIAKTVQKYWSVNGLHGAELIFQQKSIDNVGDVYGYMYLKVPSSLYKKGLPLKLKIVGENINSQDWYMTFKYEMKEKINIMAQPALVKKDGKILQLIDVEIDHRQPEGTVSITTDVNKNVITKPLSLGVNTIEVLVPEVTADKSIQIKVDVKKVQSKEETVVVHPVIYREFWFISHSHNDIGYSDLQEVVKQKQIKNIYDAIRLIKNTASYPEGERYIWNIESLWAVENFMEQASDEDKQEFIAAVKSGSIGLSAGYANLLIGLCSPEVLIHYTDYAGFLEKKYGVNINTVMTTDVPGASWAWIPALAERGIKYISSGPNYVPYPDLGDRVGNSNRACGDKPFYWLAPDGKEKILYWAAGKGYSWFHNFNMGRVGEKTKKNLLQYLKDLDAEKYPYDMIQLRYTIPADNGTTDSLLPDFVKEWNEKYESPKLIIANVSDMMSQFEKKYGNVLPVYSGDFTPYWEDGAVSTAKEEAIAKKAGETLNQCEILSTMLNFSAHADSFYQAWRDVVMFQEHTWGAWCSISDPDIPFSTKQWDYKKAFATDAETLSTELLNSMLPNSKNQSSEVFDVYNTNSWDRTDLVYLTKEQSMNGDGVEDESGIAYPSQRMTDGRLAFLAKDIPALSAKRFRVVNKKVSFKSSLSVSTGKMENEFVTIQLNPETGAISSIIRKEDGAELVEPAKGLNQYLYVPGRDPSKAVTTKNVSIRIKESGPLVVSIEITSIAPGTEKLVQEIQLISGINRVDLINTVDKSKVREKEAVNFAFPFHVPDGEMRIDLGIGILQPDKNQLNGSCKDFTPVQHWVDISNNKNGITWTTTEAPLIEIGELINEEQSNGYKVWKTSTTLSTTFYSYVMNNYWHTNFKADQEGVVVFHYSLFPHDVFDAALAVQEGMERNQPMIVSAAGDHEPVRPLFTIANKNVILSAMKPSEDGKGIILRLYNASDQSQSPEIKWNQLQPQQIFMSDANEERLKAFDFNDVLLPFTFKTVYIEK